MVELFEALLMSAAQETIPRVALQPRVQAETPAAILSARRKFRRAAKVFHRKPDDRARRELNASRAAYLKLSSEHHQKRTERHLRKLDSRGRVNWKQLQSMTSDEPFPVTAVSAELDKLAKSPKDALNTLGKHFAETCSLPDERNAPPKELLAELEAASRASSSEDDVFKAKAVRVACRHLRKLNAAAGPDGIPARFLKHASKAAIDCLTLILNYTWVHGVLPQRWREANVVPLFKQAATDRGDPNNYRPISLTSIICKLCERLVLLRLWKLVGNRISNLQFGFRSKRSTLDALMYLDNQIRIAFSRRKYLSVAFLDISKAFDRTWHSGLLLKLAKIGITGRPWRWCRAFLTDRRLRTTQDGIYSDWFSFNAGVPQGSVLSPFLFLVFINDVETRVAGNARAAMFADDIALIPVGLGKEGDEQMQRALDALNAWAVEWRVTFNAKKSKMLCFTTERDFDSEKSTGEFKLAGAILGHVTQFDYLGVRWQQNGKWHAHFEKVAAAAEQVANFISAMLSRNGPAPTIVRQLCNVLIRTKIVYGMPVWKPQTQHDWTRLDAIAIEPLRRCLGLPRSTHLLSLLVETHTPTFSSQFDVLALKTCNRALSQDKHHPSHALVRAQQQWSHSSNPSFVVHARSIRIDYSAPRVFAAKPELPPSKDLANRALDNQVLAWRRASEGARLKKLVPLQPRIADYLLHDPRPIAIIRARLRLDRAALAESRERRGERLATTLCPTCKQIDSLDHLLLECKLLPHADLLRQAEAAGLPTQQHELHSWVLGKVDSISRKLAATALDIGGAFLLAAAKVREL